MLFSVLIANYNNSLFLKTALDSVMAQRYTNWEVILTDDASTDNFDNFIQPYLSNESIKIFKNEKNMGCGFTKRRCAENASGNLMGFLDPDDALHPDALQVMADAHAGKPTCSLISSTHFICDENLEPKRLANYTSAVPADVPYLLLSDGRVHHFASFKKSCYQNTAGISANNKTAVDQDLYYKLEEVGTLFFIDEPLYYYRIHSRAISNAGHESEAQKNHYNVIEEACLRRINNIKAKKSTSKNWIKIYRTRYYKVKILNSFRRRNWLTFIYSMTIFPFVGGMDNLVSYLRKIPAQGIGLLKQSFVNNYEIKP